MTPLELTTPARVAGELGLTCDTALQAYLLPLIRSVSQAAERYCGVRFGYKEAEVEVVTGVGGPRVRLRRLPVRSISALDYVDLDSNVITSLDLDLLQIEDLDADGFGSSGLVYRAGGFPASAQYLPLINPLRRVGTERPAFRITYAGGWVTPSQAESDPSISLERDLPYDLEDAVALEVASRKYRRGRDQTIKSEKILSASVTYKSGSSSSFDQSGSPSAASRRTGLSDDLIAALNPYRFVSDGVI